MRRAMLALLFAVLACGGSAGPSGSSGGAGTSGADLDPALSGTWSGNATLTLSGEAPQPFAGALNLAVSGQNATFNGVCLDGSGSLTLHGSGRAASWQGSYPCTTIGFTGCSAVTMTFQSASVALTGNTLAAQASGSAAGCGLSKSFTIALTGTKA